MSIPPEQKLVILGGNGSGKSTLLQVISGFVAPTEGEVVYTLNNKTIAPEQVQRYISLASPYLQLIEEFTLIEMAEHAARFKPFANQLSPSEFIRQIQLTGASHKTIREFSSGMKQRLKLGLALLSDTPLILLDEPLSNLDKDGIRWYQSMIDTHTQNRTVIVCSNAIEQEYAFCNQEINVMDYKPKS